MVNRFRQNFLQTIAHVCPICRQLSLSLVSAARHLRTKHKTVKTFIDQSQPLLIKTEPQESSDEPICNNAEVERASDNVHENKIKQIATPSSNKSRRNASVTGVILNLANGDTFDLSTLKRKKLPRCPMCDKTCHGIKGLVTHIRFCSADSLLPPAKLVAKPPEACRFYECGQKCSCSDRESKDRERRCPDPDCNQLFETKRSLVDHVNLAHPPRKPGHCSTEQSKQCPFYPDCGKKSKQHVSNSHHCQHLPPAKQPSHQCVDCDQMFLTSTGLNNHMRQKHAPKRYTCNKCSKSYFEHKTFRLHMAVCGKAKTIIKRKRHFVCAVCDFATNSSNELYSHQMEVHTRKRMRTRSAKRGSSADKQVVTHCTSPAIENPFSVDTVDLDKDALDSDNTGTVPNESSASSSCTENELFIRSLCPYCTFKAYPNEMLEHVKTEHFKQSSPAPDAPEQMIISAKKTPPPKPTFDYPDEMFPNTRCTYCGVHLGPRALFDHIKSEHLHQNLTNYPIHEKAHQNVRLSTHMNGVPLVRRYETRKRKDCSDVCAPNSEKKPAMKLDRTYKYVRYQCAHCEFRAPFAQLARHTKTKHPGRAVLIEASEAKGGGTHDHEEQGVPESESTAATEPNAKQSVQPITFIVDSKNKFPAATRQSTKEKKSTGSPVKFYQLERGRKYPCQLCTKKFSTKVEWREHLKLWHPDQTFLDKSDPEIVAETPPTPIVTSAVCPHCQLDFAYDTTLRKHLVKCQVKNRTLLCADCGEGCQTEQELNEHRAICVGEKDTEQNDQTPQQLNTPLDTTTINTKKLIYNEPSMKKINQSINRNRSVIAISEINNQSIITESPSDVHYVCETLVNDLIDRVIRNEKREKLKRRLQGKFNPELTSYLITFAKTRSAVDTKSKTTKVRQPRPKPDQCLNLRPVFENECHYCSKRFSSALLMNHHVQIAHSKGEQLHRCYNCSWLLNTSEMISHLIYCGKEAKKTRPIPNKPPPPSCQPAVEVFDSETCPCPDCVHLKSQSIVNPTATNNSNTESSMTNKLSGTGLIKFAKFGNEPAYRMRASPFLSSLRAESATKLDSSEPNDTQPNLNRVTPSSSDSTPLQSAPKADALSLPKVYSPAYVYSAKSHLNDSASAPTTSKPADLPETLAPPDNPSILSGFIPKGSLNDNEPSACEPQSTRDPLKCAHCELTYGTVAEYNSHMQTEHGQQFVLSACGTFWSCSKCRVLVHNNRQKAKHILKGCASDTPHQCKDCPQEWRFRSSTELLAHQKKLHKNLYMKTCGTCGKEFRNKNKFANHIVGCLMNGTRHKLYERYMTKVVAKS